jgi:hypothetical protein
MNEDLTRESRESTRYRTIFGGRIFQDGKMRKCTIHDVSVHGARVKVPDGLAKSPRVRLSFDKLETTLPLKGEIIWVAGQNFGIRFTDDVGRLDDMMGKLLPSRWQGERQRVL